MFTLFGCFSVQKKGWVFGEEGLSETDPWKLITWTAIATILLTKRKLGFPHWCIGLKMISGPVHLKDERELLKSSEWNRSITQALQNLVRTKGNPLLEEGDRMKYNLLLSLQLEEEDVIEGTAMSPFFGSTLGGCSKELQLGQFFICLQRLGSYWEMWKMTWELGIDCIFCGCSFFIDRANRMCRIPKMQGPPSSCAPGLWGQVSLGKS